MLARPLLRSKNRSLVRARGKPTWHKTACRDFNGFGGAFLNLNRRVDDPALKGCRLEQGQVVDHDLVLLFDKATRTCVPCPQRGGGKAHLSTCNRPPLLRAITPQKPIDSSG